MWPKSIQAWFTDDMFAKMAESYWDVDTAVKAVTTYVKMGKTANDFRTDAQKNEKLKTNLAPFFSNTKTTPTSSGWVAPEPVAEVPVVAANEKVDTKKPWFEATNSAMNWLQAWLVEGAMPWGIDVKWVKDEIYGIDAKIKKASDTLLNLSIDNPLYPKLKKNIEALHDKRWKRVNDVIKFKDTLRQWVAQKEADKYL
jgi:hypothetical protein